MSLSWTTLSGTQASAVTSIIVAGQTLTAGGVITIGGDIVSLAPDGKGLNVVATVADSTSGGEAPSSTESSARATISAFPSSVFFQTVWSSLTTNVDSEVPSQLDFIVPSPPSTITQQSSLTLVLLWTSAQEGIPVASNVWALANISYNCLQSGTPCPFVKCTTGVAQLDLAYNPTQDIPGSNLGGEAILNFFLCFATDVDPKLELLTCESYSTFFNINISSNNTSNSVNRARVNRGPFKRQITQTNTLFATPTGLLVITQSTAFMTTTSVNFPKTATASPSRITSIISGSTVIFESDSPSKTLEIIPGAHTTLTSTLSSNASPTSTLSPHTRLTTGSEAGIGIAAVVIGLVIIAVIGYIFSRRNRRAATSTGREQEFEKPELATAANLTPEEKKSWSK